jgi:phosphomannomutase/phosphoglucomutase
VIFREYDIRGIVGKELTPDLVELIGKAFGTYIKGKSVVVGRDNRSSSLSLRNALVKGLTSTGCDVLDVGVLPSPLLYFSVEYYKRYAGVMITGSHNPKEYNGLKLSKGTYPIYGKEIHNIKGIIESARFRKGKGSVKHSDVKKFYVAYLKRRFRLKKSMKIVIDSGNGTTCLVAPRVFRAIGCKVVSLYCSSDPSFPHHLPDPNNPKNLTSLIKRVKSSKADLGLAFDGDGDRLGIVDSKGRIYNGELLMVILSRDLLERKKKARIVVEVKMSDALLDDIKHHGGTPIVSKTGHSFIEDEMKKHNSMLGGEFSGHLFIKEDYFGYDDALFAAAKVLNIISSKKGGISKLVEGLPKYYTSKEIRIKCSEDKKFVIVQGLKKYFKGKNRINSIDGVKIHFKEGWALVRASNTQPVLDMRFEAKSKKALDRIKREVYARIR